MEYVCSVTSEQKFIKADPEFWERSAFAVAKGQVETKKLSLFCGHWLDIPKIISCSILSFLLFV